MFFHLTLPSFTDLYEPPTTFPAMGLQVWDIDVTGDDGVVTDVSSMAGIYIDQDNICLRRRNNGCTDPGFPLSGNLVGDNRYGLYS